MRGDPLQHVASEGLEGRVVQTEDVSSLLERSEKGSTCCRSTSCPSLHADTQPRTEAAPAHSRGLAVFPSEESFIDVLHQRTFLVIQANFN